MSELRKIISLFIGLIVVLLIVSYTFGKLGFYSKNKTASENSGSLAGIFGIKKTTPTPSVASKKLTIKQIVSGDESKTIVAPQKTLTTNYQLPTTKQVAVPNSIPSTGAETVILPLLLSGFAAGTYLRRKS